MSSGLTDDQVKVLEELRKCKASFLYFSQRYLKILDADGNLIPFVLNHAQRRLVETLTVKSRHVYIIKARQLGSSTVIAAFYFWLMMFNSNFNVAVVAHTSRSAKKLLMIYRRYYEHLPDWMKEIVPLGLASDATETMAFDKAHGSRVEAYTAGSEAISGSTYQALHLSEFPKWDGDVDVSLASALQVASGDATIIFEGTAKGPNHGYEWWEDEQGYFKLFLSWMDDERCVLDEPPPEGIPPAIAAFAMQFQLTPEQINWAAERFYRRCGANIKMFNQEYPLSAVLAFILSGDRFFDFIYYHLHGRQKAMADAVGPAQYIDPKDVEYVPCVMGIDTAGGSTSGSHCSWTVLSVHDKKSPKTASTFYQRGIKPIEFARMALAEARRYNALAVMELNLHGETVLEYFLEQGYSHIYLRQIVDSTTKTVVSKWGWQTDEKSRPRLFHKLYEYIARGWLKVVDHRMMKEMNTFIYNENGRMEAEPGKCDDMIVSHGLAVQGIAQTHVLEERAMRAPPKSIAQIVRWEEQTGNDYDSWDFDAKAAATDDFDASVMLMGG